jgi:hypothetical protein
MRTQALFKELHVKLSKLSKAALIVIGITAVLGIAGVVVMSLWNWFCISGRHSVCWF